jgi:hypothetical protein
MTPIEIRINGVAGIKYQQPATVAKYDELAKAAGRCLSDACSKHLYHSAYTDIRAGITKELVKQGLGKPKLTVGKDEVTPVYEGTGDEAKIVGYTTGKGKKLPADSDVKVEPDKAFFARICAEQKVSATHFTDLIQRVANKVPFDPSKKVRAASGPRKLAKAHVEAAQSVLDAGDAVVQQVLAQLNQFLNANIVLPDDAEGKLQTLAAAIADNELREKREREAQTKAKYLGFANVSE